jgi:hypothetical protein
MTTQEIKGILKYSRDDYTAEAITILEEILRTRESASEQDPLSGDASDERLVIASAADAVTMLNRILKDLLDGTIEPERARAAAAVTTALLQAMEYEASEATAQMLQDIEPRR